MKYRHLIILAVVVSAMPASSGLSPELAKMIVRKDAMYLTDLRSGWLRVY
ncbi:MAG: hypothetical protein V4819_23355 [Verrucomicrobiota bacterium]